MTLPAPNSCRHCGIDEHVHGRRWSEAAGWHQWVAPDDAMRLERMRARRAARQLQAVIGDTEHRLTFQPGAGGRTVTVHIDPPLPDRED